MTKKDFCRIIVDTIDNMNYIGETSKEKQTEAVMALISPLKPKSLKKFAKWGQPENQAEVDKCWE